MLVSESCILINKVCAELKVMLFYQHLVPQFGGQNLLLLLVHMGICSFCFFLEVALLLDLQECLLQGFSM